LIGILLGVLCQLTATLVRWPPLSYLGLVCVLRGLLVCAGGRTWAAPFNFPLLYLFFMFPVPVTWSGFAALWLQDVVSRVSEAVLGLFVVCHRVGHTIRIAGVEKTLVVAEECSGLGQIVAFFAFAALLGHFLARPIWSRIALLAASVPIAILANTLRVVLMNLGAYWFGTNWMGGLLHDVPALFSIPVGLALFLLLDQLVASISRRQRTALTDSLAYTTQVIPASYAATNSAPQATSLWLGASMLAATALLAIGTLLQLALLAHLRGITELSYPPLNGPLESLPLAIPDARTGQVAWRGRDLVESCAATRARLPFQADDLLVRGYQNTDGAVVQLYMVYSRAGEDRKHHPEICIRDVSGSPEDVSFRKAVPLNSEHSTTAQRFRFQPGGGRAVVVYYWHYTPVPLPDPGRSRLQTLYLRVGMTAPSITVQVTAATDDSLVLDSIERQLLPSLDFAAHNRILPLETETGSNRLPIGLIRQ
jgi:exosortase